MSTIRSLHRARRTAALAVVLGTALGLSACGEDETAAGEPAAEEPAGEPAAEEPAAEEPSAEAGVLEVSMTDFSFGDLPDEVSAGTRITIENTSTTELHELVAFRLPDDEQRPADEIVADGLDALLAGAPPAMVLLAAPGGEQIVPVGDGTLTEPGRYLLLCAIPTGADPEEYLAAAATSEGPPQVEGGAPHFAHGMFDDIVVTG